MKVRKGSWHYRLWRFGRESSRSEPRDLCRYFWHLALVKVLLPLTIVGFALAGIGWVFWLIFQYPLEAAGTVLAIVLVAAFILGMVFGIRKLVERHERKEIERESLPPEPPKEPSVVLTYLAARKRKVCPLIEVVDE